MAQIIKKKIIFLTICKSSINGYVNDLRSHLIRLHGISIGTGSPQSSANFVCGQSYHLFNSLRNHITKSNPILKMPSDNNNSILTIENSVQPINSLSKDNAAASPLIAGNVDANADSLSENELNFLDYNEAVHCSCQIRNAFRKLNSKR